MNFFDSIIQQLNRVRVTFVNHSAVVLVELLVVGVLVYLVLRFLRGTRGARVIKGLMLVLIIVTLTINAFGAEHTFDRIFYLYNNFLDVVTLGLVIVFQPEIRRALVRLGVRRFCRFRRCCCARVCSAVFGAWCSVCCARSACALV